jgi:hypothetical protein
MLVEELDSERGREASPLGILRQGEIAARRSRRENQSMSHSPLLESLIRDS